MSPFEESPERNRPAGPRATIGFLFSLLLLLPAACGKAPPREEGAGIIPVEVLVVQERPVEEISLVSGFLEAYRTVDLVSEVSGEVERIGKEMGDPVSKGEILASLDKEVAGEALHQAEAALSAAEARWVTAESDFVRDSTLFASGDISPAAYESSRMTRATSSADLRSARAARALAARALRESDIRAPFDGIVARRRCEVGTYVTPGTPLFRVVDIDSLRLRLGVSQANVARLGPGAMVRVSVDALGGRTFDGRIRSISPAADEMTRTFAVEVVLANPEGRPLRDGFVVRASLVLDRREEVLAVPREAVLRQGEESYVFVADDSVAVKREVRVGPMVGDLHMIDEGLRPGERVVIVGMQNLKDQSPVRVEAVRD